MINKNIESIANLTPMQMGILYHKELEAQSSSYILQQEFKVVGKIEDEKISQSLDLLSAKYGSLRTIILHKKVAQPRQVILKTRKIEFESVDLSDSSDKLGQIEKLKNKNIQRGFDLEKDSLLRVIVVHMSEHEMMMIWCAHHIILDGWCFPLLFRDFLKNYQKISEGESIEDIVMEIEKESQGTPDYHDYVKWLEKQNNFEGLSYWEDLLVGYDNIAEINGFNSPDDTNQQVANVKKCLSMKETNELKKVAANNHLTLSTVIETAWGLVLQAYNRVDDVVFGKVVSGRNADLINIEQMVGLFINTVPVRVQTEHSKTLLDVLKNQQNQALNSSKFDFCSLADIQQKSFLKQRLFETLFIFENYYVDEGAYRQLPGVTIEPLSDREQTNYPVTIKAYEMNELHFDIMYDPRRYSQEEMTYLLDKTILVIQQMLTDILKPVSALEFVTETETDLIFNEFNQVIECDYQVDNMVALLENSFAKGAENTAIICNEESVTYQEFNERVNQMAHLLRKKGVQPNDFVGLIFDRSMEMLISLCAVVKAGGAYVPIAPNFPKQRIEYIINDSQPKIILTNQKMDVMIGCPIINWSTEIAKNESKNNLALVNKKEDACYCIYTSGTTGNPKGVVINHSNVMSYCLNKTPFLESVREKGSSIVSVTNYTFDIFITESLFALSNQVKVILADDEQINDPYLFSELLNKENPNVIQTTPSKMKFFGSTESRFKEFHRFKTIILGGEPFVGELFINLKKNSTAKIFNVYGPTETTVWITDNEVLTPNATLGHPIKNNQVYIINDSKLCGVGIVGELCVAGENVGRGYLNNPSLTAEKFIPNPYGKGKLYATGDLARWCPDGSIDYISRKDNQYKIRGYRIELGEIESVIAKVSGINNIAVVVQLDKTNEPAIYAYFVSDNKIDTSLLREEIKKELPDYMIPSFMMQIDEIPVTTSGKLNQRLLPTIEETVKKENVAPRNETEQYLLAIYQEVLGVSDISVFDNFFELGGHSLKLTGIVNKVERQFGVRVPLKELFNYPTIDELGRYLTKSEKKTYERIPLTEKKDYYPLTSSQLRMYVLNEMTPDSISYNLPMAFKVSGRIDSQRIEKVFQMMVDKHKIFRTNFLTIDGKIYQKTSETVRISIEKIANQTLTHQQLINRFVRPFDLADDVLVRVGISEISDKESLLLIDMHHIIADGVSLNLFVREFAELYNGKSLEKNDRDYLDYSQWLLGKDMHQMESYWLNAFSEELPVLNLPLDHTRPKEQSFSGETLKTEIPVELVQKVKEISEQTETTEFMIYLTTYMILLSKYSMQEKLVVGTPVSGRSHQDTENMLGMFVNSLALKGHILKDKSFEDNLELVKKTCLDAYQNQEYPFEKLVDQVETNRSLSRNPLFDTMFVLQNEQTKKMTLDKQDVVICEVEETVAKFDLTLTVTEHEKAAYGIHLNYCTALFKQENMVYLLEHYMNLLNNAVEMPEQLVCDLKMTSKDEDQLVLRTFNNTELAYDKTETVHSRFNKMVQENSDKKAVIFEKEELTYQELNELSNQLAWDLKEKGIGTGNIIGIMMSRSVEMIIAQLGIIKAGAAFVAIDPSYPKSRISFILNDSKASFVLTKELVELPDYTGKAIQITRNSLANGHNKHDFPIICQSKDLMYCIYTSGTTGVPKGVMIKHQGLINLNQMFIKTYNISSKDTILQFSNYIFDASIFEIYMALLTGATLYIPTRDLIDDSNQMSKFMNQEIDVTILPPQYAMTLDLKEVRLVITGGSSSNRQLVEELTLNNSGRYVNAYGPSEGTICASTWEYEKGNVIPDLIPIGKPNPNTELYVVQDKNICGVGVPGELCIAGDGVGLGYLNRPEITCESFIENPYGSGQLYYTGDLVRWLATGELEYMGRLDTQVKIRGYRIELGEVETAIRKQQAVKDVAVINLPDRFNNQSIYAYLVSKDNQSIDLSVLKENLQDELPEYMIPQHMLQISELPITLSGKLDVKSLPSIEESSTKEFVEAKNTIEVDLLSVFKEIIGVENISTTDDFYALGGDSINAIRIVSRLREKGYQITVKDILSQRTIQQISKSAIETSDNEVNSQEEVVGDVLLTPIQKYFFEQDFSFPEHFNQGMVIKAKERINSDSLKQALTALVTHHDQLRATYKNSKQTILSSKESNFFDLTTFDYQYISDESSEFERLMKENNNKIQQHISLENGPLMRVALYKSQEADYLMFTIHHLVVDGVSWRILLADFEKSYLDALNGLVPTLPPKTASFKAWSQSIITFEKSETLKKEVGYWEKVSREIMDNHIDSDNKSNVFSVSHTSISLSEKETKELLYETNQAYGTTINDCLLTALGRAVGHVNDQRKISVQLEGHGREETIITQPIDRTVGWFTSIFPIILENRGDISENLISTKEMLRRVPNNGVGYSTIRYGSVYNLPEVTPEIIFNYLGKLDSEIEEDQQFELTDLSAGDLVSKKNNFMNGLIFNGSIINNQLTFRIDYRTDLYSEEKIIQLVKVFKNSLNEIIEHCKPITVLTKTPSDFGLLTKQEAQDFNIISEEQDMNNVLTIFPLTPMQLGILYFKVVDEASSEYIIQQSFDISGNVNIEALMKSFKMLSNQHEILKTAILYRHLAQPKQVIMNNREIEVNVINPDNETEDYLTAMNKIKETDLQRGFDLEKDSLFRVSIVKKSQKEFTLLMSAHHIILDGWSFPLLFKDIMENYDWLKQSDTINDSRQVTINKKPLFSDYVKWMIHQDSLIGLNYWSNLLEDYQTVATIPNMFNGEPKQVEQKDDVLSLSYSLTTQENEKLNELLKEGQITLNTVLEVAWGLVLQAYNKTNDVVFGKVVSGRNAPIEAIESMVGVFINTIPTRIISEESQTIMELLKATQTQSINSSEFDYCSLADIQQQSELKEGLFDTLFVLENYFIDDTIQQGMSGLTVKTSQIREKTNYPITVKAFMADGLTVEFLYDSSKYINSDMEWLMRRLKNTLNQMTREPMKQVYSLSLCDEEEEALIENNFVNSRGLRQDTKNIITLFEEKITEYSSNIAVKSGNNQVTYNEFNERINQFARYLRKTGMKPNEFVAIIGEKDIELLIMIFGVIKAGGAYTPIDIHTPNDRILYMLKDSNCQRIITTYDDLGFETNQSIEFYHYQKYNQEDASNLEHVNVSSDLIYCIYTSGTTGLPKGVLVEHKNVMAFAQNSQDLFEVTSNDVMAQFASYTFDAFILELVTSFANGIPLVMITKEIITDGERFKEYCETHGITAMMYPPTYYLQSPDVELRQVITGGAVSNPEILERATRMGNYFNVYGPTETTVIVTTSKFPKNTSLKGQPPIGPLLPNVKGYVVNQNRQCGVGLLGELWIGGETVTRGYLNQPELTAEKFINNPFSDGRVYRTGDLARWLPDGSLEYMGRIDKQVQIRGFRVELGEIEVAFRNYVGVSDAVVIMQNEQLAAYVVSEDEIDLKQLRSHLNEFLPDYMVPGKIMRIPEIPLNGVGKINERMLPEIKNTTQTEYRAPETAIEKQLCSIFADVLGVSNVGVEDDFFLIGGDSIKAMQLLTRLRKQNFDFTIKDIFQLRTVLNLSEVEQEIELKPSVNLEKANQGHVEKIEEATLKALQDKIKMDMVNYQEVLLKQSVENYYPLSPAQITSYDMEIVNSFARFSIKKEWNTCHFSKVWHQILNEFSLLRSTITLNKKQKIWSEYELVDELPKVPFIDISIYEPNVQKLIINKLTVSFSLFIDKDKYNGKHIMHNVLVAKTSDVDFTVLVPISHLIFDGFSNDVLASRLTRLYLSEEPIKVEKKAYSDYCELLQRGPKNVSPKEISDMFELEKFERAIADYHHAKEVTNYQSIDFSLDLTEQLKDATDVFELAEKILMAAYQFAFPGNDVPLLFIQMGRHYLESNFSDYVGEFLDIFPEVLDHNNSGSIFTKMNQQATFCQMSNVNLMSIRKQPTKGFEEVNRILRLINLKKIEIPIVNVLLMYQDNQMLESDVYKSPDQAQEKNYFVTINLKENQLVFNNLECPQGREVAMKRYLQRKIKELIK